MLAAVVPREHALGHASSARKRKNAFEMARSASAGGCFELILGIVISSIDHLEKVSWWKLLVVADNNDLFGARDNAQRILRSNLTRFVNDKEVEANSGRCKELSYRQWTHKKYRLQALNR